MALIPMFLIGQAYAAQLSTLAILGGVIAIAGIVFWATNQSGSRTTTRHPRQPRGQDPRGGHHYMYTPPTVARHYNSSQPNKTQWTWIQHTALWPGVLIGPPERPSPVPAGSKLSAAPPTQPEFEASDPVTPYRLQQRRQLSRRSASSIHHRNVY